MKQLSKSDMIANVRFEAFDAVGPHDEPDLKGSETPAERDLPISIVCYKARVREFIAQIRRGDGERVGEIATSFNIQATSA